MTDRPAQPTYFDRIGGGSAVRAAVDEFYVLVLGDDRLRPYFAVDMDRLKRHQAALLSSVLGGPAGYEGRELGEAHASLGITGPHYKLVCDYLVSVLWRLHIDQDIIDAVRELLATLRDTIVTGPA
jgi:hemoglobin